MNLDDIMQTIGDEWASDATLSAIIAEVYLDKPDEDEPYPMASYSVITGDQLHETSNSTGRDIEVLSIQFSIFANEPSVLDAVNAVNALTGLFDDASFSVPNGTYTNIAFVRTNLFKRVDDEGIHQFVIEYEAYFHET